MSFGDIVQTKTAVEAGTGYSYVSAVLDSAPTEDNLLVACHFTGAADSQAPSGFTEAVALTDGSNNDQGAIYYKIAGSGESSTITANSDANDEQMLSVLEIEGPWNATPLDKTASAGPSSTSSRDCGTTASTSQADEVAVAMITARATGVTVDPWSDSFVSQTDGISSTWKSSSTATKLLSSTGTVTTTATLSSSTTSMGGIATFKKSGGGSPSISINVAEYIYRGIEIV